ncbi:hypothetical protein [Streptococcus sp. E17BB]|uniref:hypothetical protein n=1 Tax=Streptococcus sp. E17BB TaxID=3278714 RepID=UPI00359D015D
MIDLEQRYYHLQFIGKNQRVTDKTDFLLLRHRKIDQLRRDLENINFLSWKSIPFGQLHYHDSMISYAYDFDLDSEEGQDEGILKKHVPKETLPQFHRFLEQAIGTTFGSYKVYED